MAYFVGRALGGPKLAPSISPGKTWSGAIGGAVFAVAAAFALCWAYGGSPRIAIGLLALFLSVCSQVGDLFESALADLIAHRQREGDALRETLYGRLDAIDALVDQIRRHSLSVSRHVAQRLQQRLAELETSVDPDRLEQEVALLASRGDIAEELDRLRIHVEEARTALRGPGPHGRRLDFLTQELNREANTVGAKSVQAEISQRAVDLKVVIEQIREQVQNLE